MAAHPDDTEPVAPTVITFRSVDEITWTPVQCQRNADGTESVIRERWPIIRPGFLSAYVHYERGMVVRRHGHRSNHVVILLGGDAEIAGEDRSAGTHVHVPLGAAFGPLVAGPDGVTCWEVSFGEFGGWGDQPELFDAAVARLGVTPLPDPPIELGDWFVDPRGDWGVERATPRVPGLAEVVVDLDALAVTDLAPGARAVWAVEAPDLGSCRIDLDPGVVTLLPGPGSHRLALVVSGSADFDGHRCGPGTHVEIPSGHEPGCVTAGDAGAQLHLLVEP